MHILAVICDNGHALLFHEIPFQHGDAGVDDDRFEFHASNCQ
jgi:hypothetical protein